MQYIRFSEDYTNNILIPDIESPFKYIKNINKPYFISMMKYTDKQYNEWLKTKSLAKMSGSLTDRIWADFDSKDVKTAFNDAKIFYNRLKQIGLNDEHIQISFSGNKGVGFIIDLEDQISLEDVKCIVMSLAKDLKTFDTSMYDHQRIFRLLFTRNEKTGFFKIPLTSEELLNYNLDSIVESSKDITNFNKEDVLSYYKRFKINDSIKTLFERKEKVEAKVNNVILPELKECLENIPKGWKPYKWALACGFFESGERHNALMVIAATCRGLKYNKAQAYYFCKSALKAQAERYGEEEFSKEELYENIIEKSVYSDNWEGGQYSPQTNPWLNKYCQKMGFEVKKEEEFKARRIHDIQDEFEHFVKHIDENTVLTGIKCLDQAMPITTGMNLGIVGAASSGKTALALEILKNTSKAGVVSVFASLDMHRNRLFEKLLYKTTGLSRGDLYAKIQAGEIQNITKKIKEDYANVWFYDRSCPTVNDIREYIEEVEAETGKKVKLVMLDYFERVNSDKSEDTAASKDIAGQLQDLVNDFNVAMVTLVQPNKFSLGSGPDKPIKSYTAIKGSSFLYQSFRSIISIWRPFFTPETADKDKFLQMAILKNDLGELGMFNFAWSGKRGEIREVTEEEEAELEYLLEQKKKAESDNDSSGEWQ
jgi:hypothetical protein